VTTDAFLGVSILFATSVQRVHSRRASQARLCSARSVSRALDGLLLTVPCRLVSSCCHVQDSRSRGFLPRLSRTTSSVARPSAPLAPSACRRLPDDASSLCVDLEVLIRAEIRSIRRLFRPTKTPESPLAIRSFGLRSASLEGVVTASSARALTSGAHCAPAADLQRIDRLTSLMSYP
jgi:hypothetical protein